MSVPWHVRNSACALFDSENLLCDHSAWYCQFTFYNSFFFSLEDPAVFCIALELVSQLSFCVKLSSCEKRTVREALLWGCLVGEKVWVRLL
jgi:hypothetical protein